jgi:hypothetical protein
MKREAISLTLYTEDDTKINILSGTFIVFHILRGICKVTGSSKQANGLISIQFECSPLGEKIEV